MKAAGNHQMQHQPEVPFYSNPYAFADPPQFTHSAPFHFGDRWFCSAKQEGTCQPYVLDWPPYDPRFKGVDVSNDIGQFRHAR